jgi:hypothetical protein
VAEDPVETERIAQKTTFIFTFPSKYAQRDFRHILSAFLALSTRTQ